jgi:hypothetical protein
VARQPTSATSGRRMTQRARRLVIISLVLWVLCLAAYISLLVVGRGLGDLGCEYPTGSSV